MGQVARNLDSRRTVRDVAGLCADRATVAHVEHQLMSQPEFAAMYRRRACSRPPRARDPIWPADSFGAVLRDFQAWYGIPPNFLPVPFRERASPIEFAASLLAKEHDAYHVLCEYETSDHEEVALQSFLYGQVPIVFACFVTTLIRCPQLGAAGFQHLRTLLDSELDRDALLRGRGAQPLLTRDLSSLRGESIARLRRELAIKPRHAAPTELQLRNTCGGKCVDAYFHRRPLSTAVA